MNSTLLLLTFSPPFALALRTTLAGLLSSFTNAPLLLDTVLISTFTDLGTGEARVMDDGSPENRVGCKFNETDEVMTYLFDAATLAAYFSRRQLASSASGGGGDGGGGGGGAGRALALQLQGASPGTFSGAGWSTSSGEGEGGQQLGVTFNVLAPNAASAQSLLVELSKVEPDAISSAFVGSLSDPSLSAAIPSALVPSSAAAVQGSARLISLPYTRSYWMQLMEWFTRNVLAALAGSGALLVLVLAMVMWKGVRRSRERALRVRRNKAVMARLEAVQMDSRESIARAEKEAHMRARLGAKALNFDAEVRGEDVRRALRPLEEEGKEAEAAAEAAAASVAVAAAASPRSCSHRKPLQINLPSLEEAADEGAEGEEKGGWEGGGEGEESKDREPPHRFSSSPPSRGSIAIPSSKGEMTSSSPPAAKTSPTPASAQGSALPSREANGNSPPAAAAAASEGVAATSKGASGGGGKQRPHAAAATGGGSGAAEKPSPGSSAARGKEKDGPACSSAAAPTKPEGRGEDALSEAEAEAAAAAAAATPAQLKQLKPIPVKSPEEESTPKPLLTAKFGAAAKRLLAGGGEAASASAKPNGTKVGAMLSSKRGSGT